MKKRLIPFFIFCSMFLTFQCDDKNDNNTITQAEDRDILNIEKQKIEDLAVTSVCSDTFVCEFIDLGSKPCGGPWSYLVYSTSIDVQKLKQIVATYNQNEVDFNEKWGVYSDCSVPEPPTNVICENNKCVAIY
jgi:hypothetical protein